MKAVIVKNMKTKRGEKEIEIEIGIEIEGRKEEIKVIVVKV